MCAWRRGAALPVALFEKALSMLKVGGTLVYSTCSVLACENEEIVSDGEFLGRRGDGKYLKRGKSALAE